MRKKQIYNVYYMKPAMVWEDIEATSEDDAIRQAGSPPEFLSDDQETDPHTYVAVKQGDDDDESDPRPEETGFYGPMDKSH